MQQVLVRFSALFEFTLVVWVWALRRTELVEVTMLC